MPLFRKNKNDSAAQPPGTPGGPVTANALPPAGAYGSAPQGPQGQGGPAYGQNYSNEPQAQTQTQGIPPAGTINRSGDNGSSGGTVHSMSGRFEQALGTMVGSKALKEKGVQKQQEANAISLQSQELAEAERLEREALLRRERAVAHGAHPANRHLGGNINASSLGADHGSQQPQSQPR